MTLLIDQPLKYWTSGGPLLVPLALVCFAIWYYFLRTRHVLLSVLDENKDMEEQLVNELSSGSVESCRRHLASASGLLASILAGSLHDILAGTKPSAAFDARQENPLRRLSRDFKVVAALTAAAPLLGLLGTVWGMIDTFDAVSLSTTGTTGGVASGISQALITTQFGLVIAIPGVFGLARLQRLHKQVNMRLALCKTHLLVGLGRDRTAEI